MPRAKKKAVRKPAKAAKTAVKRGRRKVAVTASPQTARAQEALNKIQERVSAEQKTLQQAQADAKKTAGKGRGARPTNKRAAAKAKNAVAKSRTKLSDLKAQARAAKSRATALMAEDRTKGRIAAIEAKLAADGAAAMAKVGAMLDKAVAAFRAKKEAELQRAETRRQKAREKKAAAAVRAAQKGKKPRKRKAAAAAAAAPAKRAVGRPAKAKAKAKSKAKSKATRGPGRPRKNA